MKQFNIDFFELMFLAEAVIPPNPIARSVCFDDFSDKHYHLMRDDQRKQFFEHVQKCHNFDLENKQCRHFFARFNPKNQFLVHCMSVTGIQLINCYKHDEEYKTSINRAVNPAYIKEVKRIWDNKIIE